MTEEMILRWNLDDLVVEGGFDDLLNEIEGSLEKYKRFFESMSPDMKAYDFKQYLKFSEKLSDKFYRLHAFSFMLKETDQKNETAKLYISKVSDLGLKIDEASRKISHWFKGKQVGEKKILDDENAKRLFSSMPHLEFVLSYERKAAKYTLSQEEERIVSLKDSDLGSALQQVRDEIVTDFTFRFKPKNASKSKIIKTESELTAMFESYDPHIREAVFRTLLKKYKDNLGPIFTIYQGVVKDWAHEAEIRGYSSPISMRNFDNVIPDNAVNTLLEVCRENKGIYQDYFRWKAGQLGMDKLRRFDIYATLESKDIKVPFSESLDLILEVFKDFSPSFYEKAMRIIDSKHVDSHPRETKGGGAFAFGVIPTGVPYVMLNFTGNQRDMMVAAHELGHGIHYLYASNQSTLAYNPVLPLAETASTLCENIVFEKLFEKTDDEQVRKSMLSGKMSDSYATIMRQNYFVNFEIAAHDAKAGRT